MIMMEGVFSFALLFAPGYGFGEISYPILFFSNSCTSYIHFSSMSMANLGFRVFAAAMSSAVPSDIPNGLLGARLHGVL